MDTISLILWVICFALVLVILEPMAPQAVDLALRWLWSDLQRRYLLAVFYVQLRIQRHTLTARHPLARLLRELELRRIRRNPAYKEFFNRE